MHNPIIKISIWNECIFQAHIGPLKLQLVNTHLESTKDHSTERIKQLKDSFKTVQDFPENYTILLAGDMNLRDKEVKSDTAAVYIILTQSFNVLH
jgi:tyrosyl-DNA phosphodiesterase 2